MGDGARPTPAAYDIVAPLGGKAHEAVREVKASRVTPPVGVLPLVHIREVDMPVRLHVPLAAWKLEALVVHRQALERVRR